MKIKPLEKIKLTVGADDLDASDRLKELDRRLQLTIKALRQVSFYARINHGTKCKDYGEVVNPTLVKLGEPMGQL